MLACSSCIRKNRCGRESCEKLFAGSNNASKVQQAKLRCGMALKWQASQTVYAFSAWSVFAYMKVHAQVTFQNVGGGSDHDGSRSHSCLQP